MAERNVKGILENWGLSELAATFEEHNITTDMFGELQNEILKELIPNIGTRLKFIKQLNIWNTIVIESTSEDDDIRTPAETDDALSINISSSSFHSLAGNSDFEIEVDDCSLETRNRLLETRPFVMVDGVNIVEAAESQFKKERISSLAILLNSTNVGKSVMKKYDSSTGFTTSDRQKLVEIIITNELEGNPDKRISCETFERLSESIIELFPKEFKHTYFVRVKKMYKGKEIKSGRGKLFTKYFGMRRSFYKSGLLNKAKIGDPENFLAGPIVTDVKGLEDMCQWLHNCKEPWSTVEEYWKNTSNYRVSKLTEHPGLLKDYYSEYPVLSTRKGYLLLEIDFNVMYPDCTLNLFSKWHSFQNGVAQIASRRKDKAVKDILQVITDPDYTEDIKVLHTFLLLGHLLPTITVARTKKGQYRPSKLEVIEGYLLHVKNIGDLHEAINSRKNKLTTYGLSLQPQMIVVGSTLTSISAIYVRIDDYLAEIETPLKGIDVCFKAFHSLHASYPQESEQVWSLIQKAIYEMDTKWDKSYVGVNDMITDLFSSQ